MNFRIKLAMVLSVVVATLHSVSFFYKRFGSNRDKQSIEGKNRLEKRLETNRSGKHPQLLVNREKLKRKINKDVHFQSFYSHWGFYRLLNLISFTCWVDFWAGIIFEFLMSFFNINKLFYSQFMVLHKDFIFLCKIWSTFFIKLNISSLKCRIFIFFSHEWISKQMQLHESIQIFSFSHNYFCMFQFFRE